MLKLSTTLFERSIIPYKKLIYRKGRKFTLEKLFSSLLITSLVLGLIFAIKVYSNAGVKSGADIDTADIKTSDYDFLIEYKKQENALKNWDKFVTEFNKRNAGRVTGYVEDPFPSNYSGSFIDDYGNLHINLVETPGHVSGDELKTFFDDDSVKIPICRAPRRLLSCTPFPGTRD